MEGKVLMSQEKLRRARVLEHVVNGKTTLPAASTPPSTTPTAGCWRLSSFPTSARSATFASST